MHWPGGKFTWDRSNELCEKRFQGVLASVRDPNEERIVKHVVSDMGRDAFIGLRWTGEWQWHDRLKFRASAYDRLAARTQEANDATNNSTRAFQSLVTILNANLTSNARVYLAKEGRWTYYHDDDDDASLSDALKLDAFVCDTAYNSPDFRAIHHVPNLPQPFSTGAITSFAMARRTPAHVGRVWHNAVVGAGAKALLLMDRRSSNVPVSYDPFVLPISDGSSPIAALAMVDDWTPGSHHILVLKADFNESAVCRVLCDDVVTNEIRGEKDQIKCDSIADWIPAAHRRAKPSKATTGHVLGSSGLVDDVVVTFEDQAPLVFVREEEDGNTLGKAFEVRSAEQEGGSGACGLAGATAVELADVDGDLLADLLVATREEGICLCLNMADANKPGFRPCVPLQVDATNGPWAANVSSISANDVNGDGALDIAVGLDAASDVVLMNGMGRTPGAFAQPPPSPEQENAGGGSRRRRHILGDDDDDDYSGSGTGAGTGSTEPSPRSPPPSGPGSGSGSSTSGSGRPPPRSPPLRKCFEGNRFFNRDNCEESCRGGRCEEKRKNWLQRSEFKCTSCPPRPPPRPSLPRRPPRPPPPPPPLPPMPIIVNIDDVVVTVADTGALAGSHHDFELAIFCEDGGHGNELWVAEQVETNDPKIRSHKTRHMTKDQDDTMVTMNKKITCKIKACTSLGAGELPARQCMYDTNERLDRRAFIPNRFVFNTTIEVEMKQPKHREERCRSETVTFTATEEMAAVDTGKTVANTGNLTFTFCRQYCSDANSTELHREGVCERQYDLYYGSSPATVDASPERFYVDVNWIQLESADVVSTRLNPVDFDCSDYFGRSLYYGTFRRDEDMVQKENYDLEINDEIINMVTRTWSNNGYRSGFEIRSGAVLLCELRVDVDDDIVSTQHWLIAEPHEDSEMLEAARKETWWLTDHIHHIINTTNITDCPVKGGNNHKSMI